jgi:hypothetical protein
LTWPILAGSFGQISVVAPLANVLAIWLVVPLMLVAGACMLISSFIHYQFVFAPVYWLAHGLNFVANSLGSLSWSSVTIDYWPGILTFSYYCFIVLVIKHLQYDSNSDFKN